MIGNFGYPQFKGADLSSKISTLLDSLIEDGMG